MKLQKLTAVVLMAGLLSGCGREKVDEIPPVSIETETSAVFETLPREAMPPETQRIQADDRFESSDGTIEYTIHIDREITSRELAVVEVVHHMASGEDAKRMAEVLMPGAEFYKARPNADKMSKIELQEKIDFYSQFATPEALKELYRRENPEDLEMVEYYINSYTEQMKNAPDKEKIPCDWQLEFEREHFNLKEEIGNRPLWEDDYCLYAVSQFHDVEMILHTWLASRADEPYSTLGISRHCQGGDFEDLVLRSRMLRTEAPTAERIEEIERKAEDLLNRMELGQWQVAASEVQAEKIGDITEYMVILEAVPVVNGLTGMIHSNGTRHSTHANLQFSANGELYYFDMTCPIEEKADVSNQISILPMEKILDKAREYLKNQSLVGTGKETYRRNLEKEHGEPIVCKREISDIEIRLGKMEMPGAHNRYFYVPFIGFQGKTTYVGADSGNRYAGDDAPHTMFWVYSFDGSVIRESEQLFPNSKNF